MMNLVGRFLDFIDRRQVVRRAMVLIVLWQLVDVYLFAKHIALRPGMSGLELAAIIAALTSPPTALMGFLFKSYGDGRNDVRAQ